MPFALNLIYCCGPGDLFAAACSTDGFETGNTAKVGPRSCWEKHRCESAIDPCLWFHAVSVGEVLLLRPLVRRWPAAGRTGRW